MKLSSDKRLKVSTSWAGHAHELFSGLVRERAERPTRKKSACDLTSVNSTTADFGHRPLLQTRLLPTLEMHSIAGGSRLSQPFVRSMAIFQRPSSLFGMRPNCRWGRIPESAFAGYSRQIVHLGLSTHLTLHGARHISAPSYSMLSVNPQLVSDPPQASRLMSLRARRPQQGPWSHRLHWVGLCCRSLVAFLR